MTAEQIIKMLKNMDWTYQMSDDDRYYQAGSRQESDLRKVLTQNKGKFTFEERRDILLKAIPNIKSILTNDILEDFYKPVLLCFFTKFEFQKI